MSILSVIGAVTATSVGGLVSRMCGGGKPQLGHGLEQWLFAAPFAVVPFMLDSGALVSLACFTLAFIAKRMGHGQYIHLGTGGRTDPANDETVDPLVSLIFGEDKGNDYWRCAFGLAVTGLVATLPIGLLLAFLSDASIFASILLALSGFTKALAYMIGYKTGYKEPTVIGEILTGVFSWGSIIALAVVYA